MLIHLLITAILFSSPLISYEGERHDRQREYIQKENLKRDHLQREILRQKNGSHAVTPHTNQPKQPPSKSLLQFFIPR